MPRLLGPAEIRALARELDLNPTKKLGQNFVHDPNTVRRIVRVAEVAEGEHVLEVGPGLGSLTLGLLEAGASVTAIEVDRRLGTMLPQTVADHADDHETSALVDRLTVVIADALSVTKLDGEPTRLVANLPYNISVPVVLHVLKHFPTIDAGLVMVQAEVGMRLCASPGSRLYGVPTAKGAWYGSWRSAGTVGRHVFWPVPNVESLLVAFHRDYAEIGDETLRRATFAVIDAAFAQRRKTLRQSLSALAGSPHNAERLCRGAGVDPGARAENLDIREFAHIARFLDAGGP